MTSKRTLLGLLSLILLFTAASALATTVSVHFDSTAGNTLGGVPVYPYNIDINNGSVFSASCDDYSHHINVGDTWPAYKILLADGDVSQTKFKDFTLYQEAAYLFAQYTPQNQAQWGDINWAIWELFTPGLNEGADQPVINGWIAQAQNNYLNAPAWADLVILTPVNDPDQELIYLNVATPEPGTLLLLGSGLVGLWSQRRRLL